MISRIDADHASAYVRTHGDARQTQDPRRLLDHVEAQTGLRFAIEDRPVPILHIERRGEAGATHR